MSVSSPVARRRSLKSLLGPIALIGISTLVLSGCTLPGPTATDGPRKPITLKIGTILPQTGTLSALGPATEASVALAAQEINEADMGITVKVEYLDSGDTTTDTASTSVKTLLSHHVSAIIGGAGSGVSKTVIDTITSAGVVQMSPADTSVDFTNNADNNLYWRTAPSDALQGKVLGNLIAEDGAKSLGILEVKDSYGTGVTATITKSFEDAGGNVASVARFTKGDGVFTEQIADLMAAKPDAIALVTFDEAKAAVPALLAAGYDGKLYFVDANLRDYSADLAAGVLNKDKGTLPGLDVADLGDFTDRLVAIDPDVKDYTYAAESYDAVVLIALAAFAADSTAGKDIASRLREVSGGSGAGKKANDFASAAQIILDGDVVDYDGYSGPVTFDKHGDPTRAAIGIFQYGPDNRFSRIDSVSP
jgi:branched-chain amino acid transport system substrate-binding protein